MYIKFGKNKVQFKTPQDLKNKREIGIYKIRDGYATIAYTKKSDNIPYKNSIKVRLPATADNYKDEAFGDNFSLLSFI